MNRDRRARRVGLLAQLFYDAQGAALGRAPATASDRDNDRIRDLVVAEEATFAEVKAIIEWLWFTASGGWWRDRIADIAGFVNAYPTLCDRHDMTFSHRMDDTGRSDINLELTTRTLTADDIARIHTAAEAHIEPDPPTADVVEIGDFQAIRDRIPPRKDIDG
ncbi:MAG: hypothetical protein AAF567_24355 [Actinomycetota bacterium]